MGQNGLDLVVKDNTATVTIVCHHCKEAKRVESYNGVIPVYCSEAHKKNAQNRRRRNRRARRRAGTEVPCPVGKVPFETREIAEVVVGNRLAQHGVWLRVHDEVCVCGFWHLSGMAEQPEVIHDAPALSPDQIETLRGLFPSEH